MVLQPLLQNCIGGLIRFSMHLECCQKTRSWFILVGKLTWIYEIKMEMHFPLSRCKRFCKFKLLWLGFTGGYSSFQIDFVPIFNQICFAVKLPGHGRKTIATHTPPPVVLFSIDINLGHFTCPPVLLYNKQTHTHHLLVFSSRCEYQNKDIHFSAVV